MLIEFFIAAARSVPDTGNVSMVPGHAKSNLEEGLIREFVPLENAFERPQNRKMDQFAYRAVISRAILAPSTRYRRMTKSAAGVQVR